jgi:dTDP-4-dehydrorhamnose reductase
VEKQMVKILITGAGGLLGHVLLQQTGHLGYDVCALYHEHKPEGDRAIRVDVTDCKAVKDCIQREKPSIVINTASMTDVDLCEREPELAMRVNGTAAGFLAEACARVKAFLVQISTDYVFDGSRGNYNENDTPAPVNQYASSKLLGERLVADYENSCIARTSVVYGCGRSYRANFGTWLYDKISKGEQVKVVTDQFASPTLNTNLASMAMELAERRTRGIVHVAGATRASRYEFAMRLAEELHADTSLLTPVDSGSAGWIARRPLDSSLNVSKATELLNNKPVSLHEGIREFVRQLHKN